MQEFQDATTFIYRTLRIDSISWKLIGEVSKKMGITRAALVRVYIKDGLWKDVPDERKQIKLPDLVGDVSDGEHDISL